MSKEKRTTLYIPKQKTPIFSLPAHTVTWESSPLCMEPPLENGDKKEFIALHEKSSYMPRKCLKRIVSLCEKYPTHPQVLNLASFIYLASYRVKKANQTIEANYHYNPDYLFAKINYADLCLRKKQVDKVPFIFSNKLSLTELYPNKKTFHVSEFRGFMVVMGLYFLALSKREQASCYHYLAYKVDPHHPNTQSLERKLYALPWHRKLKGCFLRTLKKIG